MYIADRQDIITRPYSGFAISKLAGHEAGALHAGGLMCGAFRAQHIYRKGRGTMGQVYKSIIVDAPVDKVWATIRNFHDLSWAKGVVEETKVVGDLKSDQIGAKRILNGTFEETLMALNDQARQFSYSIDEAKGTPVASTEVSNYLGTVTAFSVTEGGKTFVEWRSRWDGNDSAGAEFCGGVYGAILGAMKKSFE